MSKRKRGDHDEDEYRFLHIVDAVARINQKVNLIGVITEIGIPRKSKGTDCVCTIRIVDESNASSGISVNFFTENFEELPRVESAGHIIQLTCVVMRSHESLVNVVFYKSFSSFALYEGKEGSKFVPYQVSSWFYTRDEDKKLVAGLRRWTATHPPKIAYSDSLSLKDIKKGPQFNLICKILHVCDIKDGEWTLFVWDGTDAPPVNVYYKLDEELDNPLPLQLEATPLSRDVLCKFPTVGTVLRFRVDKGEKLGLPLLKAGTWVQFRNIKFELRWGLWRGILVSKSKFSFLPSDDDYALQCQRTNDKRVKSEWDRKPLTCFPWHSYVTDTDYPDVPFCTLMDVLTYREVIAKFRCVVRVVATLPDHPRDFRAPCGTYRLRFTLEDPTARIHAYLYAEDGEKFFGGYPSIDTMIKKHNALLGVEETEDGIPKVRRNPPWVDCCLNSYNIDENDIWGSIRYRIFATTLIG